MCFVKETATTEIYTLAQRDALPIAAGHGHPFDPIDPRKRRRRGAERGDESLDPFAWASDLDHHHAAFVADVAV